jgi:mannose-1-phosphate guanylyltransferase
MTSMISDYHKLWSIILAGNESSNLDTFITLWQGSHTPKQFCTFAGTRSLLQHTWDLADRLSHPESKVTVATHPFAQHTCRQLNGRVPGFIATEPFQKGSLPSALLGLASVRAQDPQSTIVLYPSRSFLYPEHRFLRTIQHAIWETNLLNARIVLFGVHSDYSSGSHGWLRTTGQEEWPSSLPVGPSVHPIDEIDFTPSFPDTNVPANPTPHQSMPPPFPLCNSGIVLAKVDILWNQCQAIFPSIIPALESLGRMTGGPEKEQQKLMAFRQMPSGCFWKDFLSKIPHYLAMVELQGVLWSDWEDHGHIADSLALLGKKPAFPVQWMTHHPHRQPTLHQRQEVKT